MPRGRTGAETMPSGGGKVAVSRSSGIGRIGGGRKEEVRRCFPQSAGLASVRRRRRDRDRGRGRRRSADASRRVRGSRRCGGRGETGIGAGGRRRSADASRRVRGSRRCGGEGETGIGGAEGGGPQPLPAECGARVGAAEEAKPGSETRKCAPKRRTAGGAEPAGAERAQRDGCPGESRFPQGFTRERRTEKRPRSAASPGRSRAYLLQPAPAVVGSPAAKTSCAVSPDGPRRREVRRRGMQGGDVRPGRCISRAGRRFRHERCPASPQQALRRREAPQAADRIGKKPGRTIAIR